MLTKIRLFTLILLAFFASSAIAMSSDFAIHTDAHPWDKADAEKEVAKFVKALDGKVNLEVFDADARKQLADWVEAHTDGGGNTLILTGITPTTLYPAGNAKPDGSILEEFLDAGNSIFNTGEYTFYTSEGPIETIEIPQGKTDPSGVLEPRLQPGDCLLFENRTWHAAIANLSGRTRKAVMFGYGYRWVMPMDYRTQSPALLSKLDPLGQYLVGEPFRKTLEYFPSGGESPLAAWCEQHGPPAVRPTS